MVAMVLIVATTTFVHAQPRPDELPSFRFGGGLVDMGVNVGPYRLLEPSTSVGFDLRMRWPSPATLGDLSAFQPYFLLGPTFVMTDPDHITRTLDPHADTTYGLGVRAGAGVNWSLDPNSTLFGEYRVADSVGINATLRYTANLTDQVVNTDQLKWNRFEGFIGVRWFL